MIFIVSAFALILAIFFPETMLLSEFQILRIQKLYHISEKSGFEEERAGSPLMKITGNLEKYLSEISNFLNEGEFEE